MDVCTDVDSEPFPRLHLHNIAFNHIMTVLNRIELYLAGLGDMGFHTSDNAFTEQARFALGKHPVEILLVLFYPNVLENGDVTAGENQLSVVDIQRLAA